MKFLLSLVAAIICLNEITCPPVKPGNEKKAEANIEEGKPDDDPVVLEYDRYLKEVTSVLEKDEDFKRKMHNMSEEQVKDLGLEYQRYLKEVFSTLEKDEEFKKKLTNENLEKGDLAQHLEFVSHNVRTKLDEIKRREIERLREIARIQFEMAKGDKSRVAVSFLHLDDANPDQFEVEDLKRLISQATKDLEEYDTERKKAFKDYELEKEHERRESYKKMKEDERKSAEAEYEAKKKKHHEHEKIHEPGSKAQLEEVWEKDDHLDKNDFNPKTFFKLHDTNGDGVLEPDEVEALFQSELDKVYDDNNSEDDKMERIEEMNRMREHVYRDFDKNNDSMIAYDEFLKASNSEDFKKDEGWEGIDDKDQFSEDELQQWEKEHGQPGEVNIPHDPSQQPPAPVKVGGGQGGAVNMDQHQQQQKQHLDSNSQNIEHEQTHGDHPAVPPAEHHDAQTEHHDAQTEHHDAQTEHHDAQTEHHDAPVHDSKSQVDHNEAINQAQTQGEQHEAQAQTVHQKVSVGSEQHDAPAGGEHHDAPAGGEHHEATP